MSLEKAIQLAKLNPIKPVGRNSISRFCSILTNGREEYIGYNEYRTHPLQAKFAFNERAIYLHSEISAILKAIRSRAKETGVHYNDITDLSDYRLYVARILKDDSPALAKPCSGCMRALEAFGITKIKWRE